MHECVRPCWSRPAQSPQRPISWTSDHPLESGAVCGAPVPEAPHHGRLEFPSCTKSPGFGQGPLVEEGVLAFEDFPFIPGTPKQNQLVFFWPEEQVWVSLGTLRGILGTRGSCLAAVPVSIGLCSFLPLEGGCGLSRSVGCVAALACGGERGLSVT